MAGNATSKGAGGKGASALGAVKTEQRLEAGTKLLTSVTSQTYQTWRARPRIRGRARYSEAVMVWTINASAAALR